MAHAGGTGQQGWGALRVSQWITGEIEPGSIPNAYKVLNSDGSVNRKYRSIAPNMPKTWKEAQAKLMTEGVTFDAADRADEPHRWTVEHWLRGD